MTKVKGSIQHGKNFLPPQDMCEGEGFKYIGMGYKGGGPLQFMRDMRRFEDGKNCIFYII